MRAIRISRNEAYKMLRFPPAVQYWQIFLEQRNPFNLLQSSFEADMYGSPLLQVGPVLPQTGNLTC